MNWMPDDPISNKPANPRGGHIHMLQPREFPSLAAMQSDVGYQFDTHFGRFDYDGAYDPSGQKLEWWGGYDVGNNNIVAAWLQVTRLDGSVQLRSFGITPTLIYTDHEYVKIDGVRMVKTQERDADGYRKVEMFLSGHRIAEGPDNQVRRMGQVWKPVKTADGLWHVFPSFTGQWDDMASEFKRWAEWLASIGAMSGKSETHFGALDNEIRSHIAKIVAVSTEHVG